MDEQQAIAALTALSHETRLRVLRRLMAEGPSGLAAGEIAQALDIPPPTLSFHLKELERAGLLRSWRRRRQIFYAVEIEGMRQLLAFLTQDCCHGHPEICGDLGSFATLCPPGREKP